MTHWEYIYHVLSIFSDMRTILKRVGGVIASVLLVVMVLLILRQYRMWSLTGDGYYLVSTGLYIVVATVFLAVVAWGLLSKDRAERVFVGVGSITASVVMLAASYHWVTGRLLRTNPHEVFGALVWTLTGVCLFTVIGVTTKISRVLGTE